MRYATPQFIESEGKIIYFLTFKQFFWLVGGGAAIILFFYTLPFILFAICSIIVATLIVVVAFIKIDNESVIQMLMNALGYFTKKKAYVWKKKMIQKAPSATEREASLMEKQGIEGVGEARESPAPIFRESGLQKIKKRIDTKK